MLTKKRWVVLLALVVPPALTELSLYFLAGDIFTWRGLAAAAIGELVSGVLLLVWKTAESESLLESYSDSSVEQPQFGRGSGKAILGIIPLLTSQQVGGALIVLAVVVGLVTVLDTPLGWWRWYSGPEDIATLGLPGVTTIPSEPKPEPIPILASSLERSLLAAKSVKGASAKDEAMRLVAKTAIDQDDYDIAIQAGRSSASSRGKSETLKFVALCAAKRGRFDTALAAADHIPSTSIHDSTKIEILSMKREQVNSGINDQEQSVACD